MSRANTLRTKTQENSENKQKTLNYTPYINDMLYKRINTKIKI